MNNPFSKIFSNLNPFKQQPNSVIGVDVGSSSIKVVQLRRRGGAAVLETYGEIALGPYADLEIGQATTLPTSKIIRALLDVMTEANVTSQIGGISIPFTSSLVMMIQMPRLPAAQLANMIPLEARKYIPVPASEVSLDWFVIPEPGGQTPQKGNKNTAPTEDNVEQAISQKTDVLLVAIHNDVLSKYKEIIQRAKLNVSFFEIEIFSSVRATIGQTLAPIAVLDIGAGKTKLYVVEYGVVKMSHLINRGSQDITSSLARSLSMGMGPAEEYKRERGLEGAEADAKEAMLTPLNHILNEANRVLISYERKYKRNIGNIILTGGGSVLKGLLPLAEQKLEADVVLGDPFGKTEAPAFLADTLKEVGPEFSVAVGLALRKLQEAS